MPRNIENNLLGRSCIHKRFEWLCYLMELTLVISDADLLLISNRIEAVVAPVETILLQL